MHPRLIRLAGLAAAAALLTAPVIAAVPSHAAPDPGSGTVTVKIVDDRGRPVTAQAVLVNLAGDPIPLGDGAAGASTFTGDVPVDSYGIAVIGGWGGFTCRGLISCSVSTFSAGGPRVSTPVINVTEGGLTTYTVTTPTPKLVGAGKVGGPLKVQVPAGLTDLANYVAILAAGSPQAAEFSVNPGVTWLRNGADFGRKGLNYAPTISDSGRRISARVSYPSLLALFFSQSPGLVMPAPFTTNAIKIKTVKPKLIVRVPATFKQGVQPTAWVTATAGRAFAPGVVQLTVGKHRAARAVLRSGSARFKLPKLKPGIYQVRVTYRGNSSYAKVVTTKKIKVTQ